MIFLSGLSVSEVLEAVSDGLYGIHGVLVTLHFANTEGRAKFWVPKF